MVTESRISVDHDLDPRSQIIVIGRGRTADLTLEDPLVSRRHAVLEVDRTTGRAVVADLGSSNGTFLNGRRLTGPTEITSSDRLAVGSASLVWNGVGLVPEERRGTVVVAARNLTQVASDSRRVLLESVNLEVRRGEFVAIVGASGSGKTTLLEVLSGWTPPSGGRVEVDGYDTDDAGEVLRPRIAFVASSSAAHPRLTVRQVLDHAARLRLSADTTAPDRIARVIDVVESLQLQPNIDQRVATLSDGQRKRLDIASELIGRPPIVMLDEPTSGLDVRTEHMVMGVLADLARNGHTVLISTHTASSLECCDRVLAVRPGRDLVEWVPDDGRSRADWLRAVLDPDGRTMRAAPAGRCRRPARLRPANSTITRRRQFATLTRRDWAVHRSDRWSLPKRLLQAPVLGLVLLLVLGDARLRAGGTGPRVAATAGQFGAPNVLLAMVLAMGFIGVANTIRSIGDDAPFIVAERRAGLSPSAYLASRAAVPMAAAIIDATLLTLLTVMRAGTPHRGVVIPNGTVELLVTLVWCGMTGALLGLAVSARSRTSATATSALPGLLVPSFLLAGPVFPLDGTLLRSLAALNPTRWGYSAAASTVDVLTLVQCEDPWGPFAGRCPAEWRPDAVPLLMSWGALAGLGMLVAIGGRHALARTRAR